MKPRRNVYLVPLVLGLSLASCEMFQSGVGKGRSDLPRIELEVHTSLDPSFAAGLEIDESFGAEVAERILSRGDVGLRFYAVPAHRYQPGQARPEYVMTVTVGNLALTPEQQVRKTKEGNVETTEVLSWIGKASCTATTQIERRRGDAPALVICRSSGQGQASGSKPTAATVDPQAIKVRAATNAASKEPLTISREKVLDAIDSACRDSLRQLTQSIDRELQQRFAPTAQPDANQGQTSRDQRVPYEDQSVESQTQPPSRVENTPQPTSPQPTSPQLKNYETDSDQPPERQPSTQPVRRF